MYKKKLSYAEMISETLFVNMKKNKKIFIAGLEVNYSSKVFGSLKKPFEIFEENLII
jgi:pyruvate/2-oxoglutarate/acetoin dehydrogenase E1 component